MRKINRPFLLIIVLFLIMGLSTIGKASASCVQGQQACSSSYGIGRYSFDSGGALDTTCSTSYCAAQTLGDTGIGNSASSNYQVQAGFNVNRQPSLELYVNSASINAGVLSTGSTATATATFSVGSYLANGYAVDTVSPGPTYGTHTLASPSSPTAATAGTEQFGINLVANTSPVSFGANPLTVPSSAYSDCSSSNNYCIASGYYTANQYQYINGSTIVNSPDSTGQVDFTISYILNIANSTPAGVYTMDQQLVAIPTF